LSCFSLDQLIQNADLLLNIFFDLQIV
jgi:hypothetical protein